MDCRVIGENYDIRQPSKFCTAFVPHECLDDQTITANFDFVPLYSRPAAGTAVTALTSSAEITTNKNGYNSILPRGFLMDRVFTSPSSRFYLSFNLNAFHRSDGLGGGVYLGNSVISLLLTGANGLTATNANYRAVIAVVCKAVYRYNPGGMITWNY